MRFPSPICLALSPLRSGIAEEAQAVSPNGPPGDAHSCRSITMPQSSGAGRGESRCVRAAAGLGSSCVGERRNDCHERRTAQLERLLARRAIPLQGDFGRSHVRWRTIGCDKKTKPSRQAKIRRCCRKIPDSTQNPRAGRSDILTNTGPRTYFVA